MTKLFPAYLFLCVALVSSCSKSSNPASAAPGIQDSTAFPVNEFFQVNGFPSLDGWTFHPSIPHDTITFDKVVPPGSSAQWSITLRKSDVPPVTNNVTRSFVNCTSGIYSLTVWLTMKKTLPDTTYNPLGSISIIKQSAGKSDTASMSSGDSIAWHPVTVLDTLTLLPSDTLTLMLSSGACDSSCHGNPLWFDDITFKKLP